MVESTMPIQWTDQQWCRVLQAVQDEANKARVGAQFLPVSGPLPPDTTTIPAQQISFDLGTKKLQIDDFETLPLVTLAVNVELTSAQASQPDLGAALAMFRRAANMIARAEDAVVFEGQPAAGQFRPRVRALVPGVSISGGKELKGLLQVGETLAQAKALAPFAELLETLSAAIGQLEANGHVGPYALVLGNESFTRAQTPIGGLVLPSDQMKPLLAGPLLRSSMLEPDKFVLVSTGGDPVEIVVASDISVRFLQMTPEGRYIFRASERFALRIKDVEAVIAF